MGWEAKVTEDIMPIPFVELVGNELDRVRSDARKRTDRPWVSFVSFVAPCYRPTAPPELNYPFSERDLP